MRELEAPLARPQTDWITRVQTRRLQIGCWVALIVVATIRAWFTRYQLTPDAMYYLDRARLVAEGHPHAAIDGILSPGYPVLIALFLRLFSPNSYWEFPLVHALNLLIFVGTLACFQMFWRETFRWHRDYAEGRDTAIPEGTFWAFGYAVFAIATLNVISVGLIEPDLLVAAFACLSGWSVLRFRRAPGYGRALLLGFVLALGYYAKAPFFPLAAVFIVCAFLQLPVSRRIVLLAGSAITVFLLACAPQVNALSRESGRLDFGDQGRLNEALVIDGVQSFRHWQGGPPGSGMPVHPTRKLSDYPEIYEFAERNMGTYPPGFSPMYWYEGITPHFILKRQLIVFARNFALTCQIVLESGSALVCVAIIVVLLAGRRWIDRFWQFWFVWVPGIAGLTMYALIRVEPRYIGGWLIMLFAGVICACRLPSDAGTLRAVRYIATAALFTVGAAVIIQAGREAVGIDHAEGRSPEEATLATELLQNGFHAEDPIAVIGDGTGAYWAHLARLQIIAEIPGSSASRPGSPAMDFWESGPSLQKKALDILQGTGARAVVVAATPSFANSIPSRVPVGWKRVDATSAYVYFFHADR